MEKGSENKTMLPPVSCVETKETTPQRCLNRLSDIRFYTASLTFAMFSFSLTWGYFLASLTTVEKRFGFGSTETGMIFGCYEIGHLSIALFISHFGNRVHIPRLLSLSFFVLGCCSITLALPHFFLGPLTIGSDPITGNATDFESVGEICQTESSPKADPLVSGDKCAASEAGAISGIPYFVLPAIIFVIKGMAGTPMSCLGVAFIDNNASEGKSPLYMGICFAAISLGPTVGFFLGAWCLLMYEDLTEPAITPSHPRWIGAWWLGLLMSGSLEILTSLPLLLVAKKRDKVKALTAGEEKVKPPVDVYTCRGLIQSMIRILRNPVFLCLTLSGTSAVYVVAGFFTFLPKYLESQFGVPAWRANSIAGLVSGFAAGLGSIVGGALVTKLKLRFRTTLLLCMISMCISLPTMLSGMLMGCDNVNLITSNLSMSPGVNSTCSSACACSNTEYYPVCDPVTGNSYLSPCHAGCQSHDLVEVAGEKMFTSCTCTSGGNATLGLCPRDCGVLIPYAIIFIVFTFAQSLLTAPGLILTMRCVKKSDKALAVGIAGCIVSILGWIMAPLVYGIVIDSACALWQTTCGSEEKGTCWLYHNGDFRIKFHGLTLGFGLSCLMFFFFAFRFSRGKNFDEDNDEERTNRTSGEDSSNCNMVDCGEGICDGQNESVPLRQVNPPNDSQNNNQNVL